MKKEYMILDDRYGRNDFELRLAQAYIPSQILGEIYSPREALCNGTLFPELFMPYQIRR